MVVATEVRSLAKQSEQATRQIRATLEQMRHAPSRVVGAAEGSSKSVDRALEVIEAAGETIVKLADLLDEVSQANVEIASATHEQSSGIAAVSDALATVRAMAVENLGVAESSQGIAEVLSRLGGDLSARLSRLEAEEEEARRRHTGEFPAIGETQRPRKLSLG